MSSTGRGPRLGGPDDFFATPAWAVRRLLESWSPPGGVWLEPGAGNGAIIRAVNEVRQDVKWIAVELRPEEKGALAATGAVTICEDFLSPTLFKLSDLPDAPVVLGNPPFIFAQPFIDRSRQLCPRAEIMLLLRLNYVGSEDRAEFMRRCPPDLRTLPNRPAFVAPAKPGLLGKTDSIEYAWFGWPPGQRTHGTFRVLASTSKEERKGLHVPAPAARQGSLLP